MNNLLYIIAVILIIGWALGFFVFAASGLIHILHKRFQMERLFSSQNL